jgi:hypothetical protein
MVLITGAAFLAGAFLALNTSPRLTMALLGLKRLGAVAAALPPESAPLTLGGERLDHVALVLPPQLVEPLTVASAEAGQGRLQRDPLVGDRSTPGTSRYLLTLDERSVNQLLKELIPRKGQDDGRYRNVSVDLQPGGLVVYADVNLGIRRQRMGLLLLQDAGTMTLSPSGVVLKGELYAAPESGALARRFLPAGRYARRALPALTIVGPLPGEARVETARFYEDRLQLLARATYAHSPPADTGWREAQPGVELREIDVAPDGGRATERLSVVRLNPTWLPVRVHYDPANPKTVSAWGAALDALLVVNGAYFAPESEGRQETIGLLVSDGQPWGTPLQDHAGMLAVTDSGEVTVRWLRDQPYDPQEALAQAMQSFPVLVKPGGVMGFPADADDGAPSRRTVVAQDGAGNVLLILAPRGMLSLHELAVFLAKSDLTIDVALNLDGGGSSGMWLTAEKARVTIDSYTSVPSVIAVERR